MNLVTDQASNIQGWKASDVDRASLMLWSRKRRETSLSFPLISDLLPLVIIDTFEPFDMGF